MKRAPLLIVASLFLLRSFSFVIPPLSAQKGDVARRAAFLALIDRPAVDPSPAVRPLQSPSEGLSQEHFSFAVSGDRVTGLLVKQAAASGRRPVVIQLHG